MSEEMIAEQTIEHETVAPDLYDLMCRYLQRGDYAPKPRAEHVSVFLKTPPDFYEEMVRAQQFTWMQRKGY